MKKAVSNGTAFFVLHEDLNLISNILTIARWLSLDVVLGGVVLCEAIAKVAKVDLPMSASAALGCSIWLIYTLDHLIDGNKQFKVPSMPRHLFHRKYRISIFIAFTLVSGLGLKLLFYLPSIIIIYGCVLLGMVGLYFLSIWLFKIYFAKELFIALLYSCGIFLGVFALEAQIEIVLYFYFGELCLLAFINLLLFSYYEVDQDLKDGHHSWVTHFGKEKTIKHLIILFSMLAFSLSIAFYFVKSYDQFILQIIFITMTMVLGFIFAKPERFRQEEQFRWIGDMIFILPALIFLL